MVASMAIMERHALSNVEEIVHLAISRPEFATFA
jgi:hypothetical protein